MSKSSEEAPSTHFDEPSMLREVPEFDWDPYDEAVLDSPYSFQEALRGAGPVVRLSRYGVYATGRNDEAKIVLSDHQRFIAAAGIGLQDIRKPGAFRIPSRLLESDPPYHTRIRKVVNKILSPLVIRTWREKVESEAQVIVADALARGEIDGVEDLVEAYILRAFPKVIGVQLPRTETLAIGEMRFNQSGPPNALYERAMVRAEPYVAWFDESCSRSAVLPGSIADLLFEAEERGDLPEGVASNIVRSLVGGGTDSTISGLGTTVRHLAEHPDQWARLKANPIRLKTAMDEGVRLEAPFQVTYRTTHAPVELSGYRLDGDTKIGVFLGAANRDPRKWDDPDRFDVDRKAAGIHLGFGTADHVCIGQMLARLEAEALLTAMVASIDRLELVAPPRFRPMNQLRTLDVMPLRVTA